MPDVSSFFSTSGSGSGPGSDQLAVRLFAGHDRTPLWFPGPRDLDETLLDEDLTGALQAWESDWYASRDVDSFEWVSTTPEIEHLRRGVDLARRLALALGSEHVVEVDRAVERPDPDAGPVLGRGPELGLDPAPGKLRVRSDGPPAQPDAARRFATWAAEYRAEQERSRSASGGGPFAHAPLSGATFPPDGAQKTARHDD